MLADHIKVNIPSQVWQRMSVKAAIRVRKQDNHELDASLGYIIRSCLKNTYTYTYIHPYTHMYAHPYIHTCVRTYIHTHVYTYIKLHLEEKTENIEETKIK